MTNSNIGGIILTLNGLKLITRKTAVRCLRSLKKGNFVSLIMKRRPELRMNLMPALCMYFTLNFIQT